MTPKQKNGMFLLLILAAFLLYIFSGGSVGVSLDFGETFLTLSASDYDWTIPYDRIESLELTELSDKGILIEGIEKRTLCCGTWENKTWGRYTLCINPKIDLYIVATMDNGDIYVLNYENPESTGQLHRMFTDLLHSKGYLTED